MTEDAEPRHRLEIKLDPNGVVAPAQQVARTAANVVAASLSALAGGELAEPKMSGKKTSYGFTGVQMTSDERRVMYQNWLLGKGFQDLARGIRETLEEAVLYLSLVARQPGTTTPGEFQQELADIRRRASRLSFPALLAEVNARLTAPMAFDAEFLTLQKTRNCLEHRGGIVGAQDIDDDGNALTLSFPRLKLYYMRAGEEIEIAPGDVIDTQDQPIEVPILLRRVTRSKTYESGERVTFTANDFYEIAMACYLFASDLGSKLPVISPPTP